MSQRPGRVTIGIVAAVAVLAAIAAGAGVLLRGDLATTPFTTVRGDALDVVTTGVYAWNSLPIVSEGVGWDLVTLLLVVPAALLVLPSFARGSLRATLVELGLLVYFLYQYSEYATFWAVGPLYPLHVLTFALALSGIALVVGGIEVAALPARFTGSYPRRGVIGLGIFMVVLLGGLWSPVVARAVLNHDTAALDGGVTLVIQAFDLGFLVPLGVFTAVAAYRRLAVGYLLASVVVVKAVAMPVAIVAMLVVEAITTGEAQVPPMLVFAGTAVASALIGVRVYGSIDAAVTRTAPRALPAARG